MHYALHVLVFLFVACLFFILIFLNKYKNRKICNCASGLGRESTFPDAPLNSRHDRPPPPPPPPPPFCGKCLALNKIGYFYWQTLQAIYFLYSLCSLEGEVSGLFLQSSVCTGAAGVRDSGYDSLRRRMSVLDRLTHTHPVWLLLPLSDEEAKHILQPQPPGVNTHTHTHNTKQYQEDWSSVFLVLLCIVSELKL